MKKVKKDVKSGGNTIGQVECFEFENPQEAIKELGAEVVVKLVNRQHASDTMNEFRAAATRETSPLTRLNKMAKGNPELAAKIEALVKQYAAAAEPKK